MFILILVEPFLKPESRVLDIGSGMGYITCCLARLCQLVIGVEHVKELVIKAQEIVQNHYQDLSVCFAKLDGRQGCEKYAPYDLILIEPLVKTFPEKLFNQLKSTGCIVAVVKSESKITMVKYNKNQERTILNDDHVWLMQNHKDTLCDLQHQENLKFDFPILETLTKFLSKQ